MLYFGSPLFSFVKTKVCKLLCCLDVSEKSSIQKKTLLKFEIKVAQFSENQLCTMYVLEIILQRESTDYFQSHDQF